MMEKRPFYTLFSPWILLITAAFVPVIFNCAAKAVKHNKNRVEDWLPSSYLETQQLTWFRQRFVADQFIIVSWDGCRLGGDPTDSAAEPDDPRIDQLAKILVAEDPKAAARELGIDLSNVVWPPGPARPETADAPAPRYFKGVTTARAVLSQLTSDPTSLPYKEAVQRLTGALIGPDGHQTCLVVTLTPEGAAHLRDAIGRGLSGRRLIRRPAGDFFFRLAMVGIHPDQVRMGGPPIDNVAIDEEGERTLIRLSGLACLLGLTLCYWSLRSVRLTSIVFSAGILSAAFGLAIVWLTGETTDAVLMSMPSLVYVLAISGAVHLINYYREALAETGTHGAVEKAIAHGWKPALLCSVTTALGLVSLCTSELTPIRKFGLYSALGVMGMLVILFLYLPAALEVWHKQRLEALQRRAMHQHAKGRQRAKVRRNAGAKPVTASQATPPQSHDMLTHFWQVVGGWILNHHGLVTVGCLLLIATISTGVNRLHTSIDLLKLFDSGAHILRDYAWLEQNLGRLVPMELVLRFPQEGMQPFGVHANEPTATDPAPSENAVATAAAMQVEDAGKLSFLDRLETTTLVERSIERTFGSGGSDIVGKTMSAATFAPTDPGQQEGPMLLRFTRRQAANQQLEKSRDAFRDSGYLEIDPEDQGELWRISVRVAAFRNVDYGKFVHDLREAVEPIVAAVDTRSAVLRDVAARRPDGSHSGGTVWLLVRHRSPANNSAQALAGSTSAPDNSTQPNGGFSLASLNPWGRRDTSTYLVSDNARKTYQAALNQMLRRSHLRVRWLEVEESQLNETLAQAETAADCVVWVGDWAANDGLAKIPAVHGESLLRNRLDPRNVSTTSVLTTHDAPSHAESVYTGVVPIVYKAQRELLNSLIESTIWSFVTITPLMMFVARGVRAGLVVMIPNSLPILTVFGGMGWLGTSVDIGSMMSASIALGVAVDDTIHFLTWYRDELAQNPDRRQALLTTYRRCASPTLQAAMISGLGLSIFALSTFTPTQKFGWLMLTILFAGVVAELVMMPALLAGPIGLIFSATQQKKNRDAAKSNSAGPPEVQPPAWKTKDRSRSTSSRTGGT